MSLKIDKPSFKEAIGESKEALVYGFSHCGYQFVGDILKKEIEGFSQSHNYDIGYPTLATKIDGRSIDKISITSTDKDSSSTVLSRVCKSAIVNLVLENYKREKSGDKPIHLIFCIDDNQNNVFELEKVALDNAIANTELRRCYKLCNDFDHAGIRDVACRTIKFVKVNFGEGDEISSLEPQVPFWEHRDWKTHWAKRLTRNEGQLNVSSQGSIFKSDWRKELLFKTVAFELSQLFDRTFHANT